jgi:hypothetical protein
MDLLKTFLLTFSSFTTADLVIQKLKERYHVPRRRDMTRAEFEKYKSNIQLRICNVLLIWTKKYPFEFQHETDGKALTIQVINFIDDIIVYDHSSVAKQIRKNLTYIRDVEIAQITRMLPPFYKKDYTFNDDSDSAIFSYPIEEIARQLTIIEWHYFSRIAPWEFMNQGWTGKDCDSKTPNIHNLTCRFNSVAWWVAKSCLQGNSAKLRAERISKFIEIANVR